MTAVQISETLRQLIEQFANMARNASEVVEQIKEQASKEGLSNEHLRELIEGALRKRGLGKTAIYEALPPELKDSTKSANRKGKTATRESVSTNTFVPESGTESEPEAPHKMELKEERKVVDAPTEPETDSLVEDRFIHNEYDDQPKPIIAMTATLDVKEHYATLFQCNKNGSKAVLTIEGDQVTKVEAQNARRAN